MFGVLGVIVGLAIGGGLVLLRATQLELTRRLASTALTMAAIAVLGFLGLAYLASNKGGDSGMAAVTWVVFLIVGVCSTALFCLVVGGYQAMVLKSQARLMARSLLVDVLLVGLAVFCYNRFVFQPAQSARINDWWSREYARREARKRLYERIPEPYRGINSAMLDDHARMRRQSGGSMPPLVPQDVENAIRNAEHASAAPPAQDRIDYAGIATARTSYQWGLGIGWLIGGLAFPLLLRAKTTPQVGKGA